MKFDPERYYNIASQDKEFNREIRYYDGTVKLIMGEDVFCLIVKEGKLISITDKLSAECPADTIFEGNDVQWMNLLAKVPKPFYQCLQTTCVRHGMQMSNDVKSLAYLPAWNRMTKMLREMLNDQ